MPRIRQPMPSNTMSSRKRTVPPVSDKIAAPTDENHAVSNMTDHPNQPTGEIDQYGSSSSMSSHTLPSSPSWPSSPVSDNSENAYSSRTNGPDAIYNTLKTTLFDRPSFAGHPDVFNDVVAKADSNKRSVMFTRNQAAVQAIVFGEMATYADGCRLTARGDKFPPNDQVRLPHVLIFPLFMNEYSL